MTTSTSARAHASSARAPSIENDAVGGAQQRAVPAEQRAVEIHVEAAQHQTEYAVDLVQGNPTEVKVVLASVATALAVYQVVLAAIGYRKLAALLEAAPAFTHRASGDTIAVLLIVVAIMCLSYFELEDSAFHAVTGFLLLVVLAVKVVVIRWWHARPLPARARHHRVPPARRHLGQHRRSVPGMTASSSARCSSPRSSSR